MSTGDIRLQDIAGKNAPNVRTFTTESAETAINPGEIVKITSSGGTYVVAMQDGDPTIFADYIVGLAAKASSHTASADGYVDVYLDTPGTVYAGKPKTAGSCNTQAKVDALMLKRIVLDVTASKTTVDTAAADASTNGVIVVGGNPATDECYFSFLDQATWRNYGHI